jgi:outer membrane protein OmpA-like peptidoglycan-associated protein
MQLSRISYAVAVALTATPIMAAQPATPAVPSPAVQPSQIQLPLPVIPGLTVPAGSGNPTVVLPIPNMSSPAAAAQDKNAQKWMERMSDFTQNASAFKDPKVFTQWYGAMTDPSIVAAAMESGMEPGYWIRMMQSMMQPAAIQNYMAFLNPNVSAQWLGGMMDPGFYLQNTWSMVDPAKMMRWMMLPLDPKFMQASINMMNPNTYMKWMMAPMDPRVWGLMFAPMNPQLYGSMAGAVINPAGMGETWETFMKPKHPVVSLMPPAGVNVPFNVLDPSTYGNMLGMVAGFLPAGTQQMFSGLVPGGAPAATGGVQAPSVPFFGGNNPYLGSTQSQATAPKLSQPVPAQSFQPGVPTKMALGGDTLFKSGKSSIKDLTAEGKAKLDELAGKIKAAGKVDTIRIIGHADKTGKASSNMKLSQKRAATVASYLKAQGVKAGKIITAGKGDTQPVVQCDDKLPKADLIACHGPNRRVEVEVTVAK